MGDIHLPIRLSTSFFDDLRDTVSSSDDEGHNKVLASALPNTSRKHKMPTLRISKKSKGNNQRKTKPRWFFFFSKDDHKTSESGSNNRFDAHEEHQINIEKINIESSSSPSTTFSLLPSPLDKLKCDPVEEIDEIGGRDEAKSDSDEAKSDSDDSPILCSASPFLSLVAKKSDVGEKEVCQIIDDNTNGKSVKELSSEQDSIHSFDDVLPSSSFSNIPQELDGCLAKNFELELGGDILASDIENKNDEAIDHQIGDDPFADDHMKDDVERLDFDICDDSLVGDNMSMNGDPNLGEDSGSVVKNDGERIHFDICDDPLVSDILNKIADRGLGVDSGSLVKNESQVINFDTWDNPFVCDIMNKNGESAYRDLGDDPLASTLVKNDGERLYCHLCDNPLAGDLAKNEGGSIKFDLRDDPLDGYLAKDGERTGFDHGDDPLAGYYPKNDSESVDFDDDPVKNDGERIDSDFCYDPLAGDLVKTDGEISNLDLGDEPLACDLVKKDNEEIDSKLNNYPLAGDLLKKDGESDLGDDSLASDMENKGAESLDCDLGDDSLVGDLAKKDGKTKDDGSIDCELSDTPSFTSNFLKTEGEIIDVDLDDDPFAVKLAKDDERIGSDSDDLAKTNGEMPDFDLGDEPLACDLVKKDNEGIDSKLSDYPLAGDLLKKDGESDLRDYSLASDLENKGAERLDCDLGDDSLAGDLEKKDGKRKDDGSIDCELGDTPSFCSNFLKIEGEIIDVDIDDDPFAVKLAKDDERIGSDSDDNSLSGHLVEKDSERIEYGLGDNPSPSSRSALTLLDIHKEVDINRGKEIEQAGSSSLVESKMQSAAAMAFSGELIRRNQTRLTLKQILSQFAATHHMSVFTKKMVRSFAVSQELMDRMLVTAKRKLELLVESELQIMAGDRRGRDLCNKRIIMGKKCRPLEPEDSVYDDDNHAGGQLVAVGRRPMMPMDDFVAELHFDSNGGKEERWTFQH